jgi:hypothetical protein
MDEFFSSLPPRAVNTRLCRIREAEEWVRRGGKIFEVVRPGTGPATEWEANELVTLRKTGLIYETLRNPYSLETFHDYIRTFFNLTA